MTSTGVIRVGHIPSLDGLRAVSIFLVIVGHGGVPGVPPSAGVTVFFFLSGYLITTLLRLEYDRKDRIAVVDFYIRRAFRILPSLYLVLGAVLVLNFTGVIPSVLDWAGTAAAALHFSNYWQAFGFAGTLPRGSGIFWSVAVEEHFYLMFPFLYLALRKWTPSRAKQTAVLVAICGAILAWRCFLTFIADSEGGWTYYATDSRADAILWGCVLAVAANPYLDRVWISRRASMLALPIGTLTFFAAELAPSRLHHSLGYTVQAVALALVFVSLVAYPKSAVGRVLNWRPVAYVGVLSYGMYLTHRLVQIPLERIGLSWQVLVPLSIVGTLVAAWLLHQYVEKPCGNLRRALEARRRERRTELEPAL